MSHRKPPLPAHYRTAPRGICRWCNEPVLNQAGEASKGRWHPACVTAFKLIHWPAETRLAVWIRDRGICRRCGTDLAAAAHAVCPKGDVESLRKRLPSYAPKWQHDHIRPLIEANGDLSFWELSNVQVLCHECHIAKGKEDNRRRKLSTATQQLQLL